ncbi:MAG TPA: family 78 glycoside hydrolase catalytic domain [Bryobacteraceae bacterium]|nr:family 78 glycoside hydrolase catalytic domain [Bryobacteraceae bacterium]
MSRNFSMLTAVVLAAVWRVGAQEIPPPPRELRVEYLADPMGVDVAQPRFSWKLEHPERGQQQTAYQVLVSLEPAVTSGDIWDSGRVASPESVHVVYGGKRLESGRTYYWKVRWWDKEGRASTYSRVARFHTGLLAASEWRGRWITGGGQLRKEFRLTGTPARAYAYISGLGYYELRINGRKVGDHVLDPGWTTYEKRVLYSTYDVTPYLRAGDNAVAVMLGHGWYGARALLLQMNIELEGGSRVEVVSDGTWKVHPGPVVSDSIYHGETYDARLETPGWDRPGFDDAGWKAAGLADPPKGVLSAQMMPPIRVVETIVPLRVTNPRPGMWVYDMGQNFSGWVRLKVRGPRGTAVKLRHAELLYDDGTINVENLRRARATDVYILRGDGKVEIYEPRFTYHGFRYVELTGYPGTPPPDAVRGRVVHTDVRPTGGFSCSNDVINRIQRLIYWGTKTNLHSVPTDCNQRDERMGWMADAHLYAETAMLNFDMPAFYTNFLRNIRDVQGEDGTVTDTVPHKWGQRPADPAWGSAYPLIAWYMYQYYGDRRILEEHYAGIKAWADFLHSKAEDGIVSYSYYGDWVPVRKTPGSLVSTFYYYWSTDLVARAAEILGRKEEAASYRKRAQAIAEAFHRKFYNAENRSYANGTQTANLLPLFLDIAPKEVRGAVWSNLVNDIVYENNTHLTTGIIGTKYLMPLLTRMNRSDLAYELASQTTYPSWGYMAENGATTLWELWQNKTGPSMNSHNHPMFGSVGQWFYNALAGIQGGPGFEQIRIEPQVVRDLRWASGSVETARGLVSSSWRRTEDGLRLEVTIPVGSQAEVHLPKLGFEAVEVFESGRLIWDGQAQRGGAPGVTSVRQTERAVICATGSGRFVFELKERPSVESRGAER